MSWYAEAFDPEKLKNTLDQCDIRMTFYRIIFILL